MTCPTEQLADLVYGFEPADADALQEHLRSCDACRDGFDRLQDEHELLSAAAREIDSSAPARRSFPAGRAVALGFAAGLLFGIAAFLATSIGSDRPSVGADGDRMRVSVCLEPVDDAGTESAIVLGVTSGREPVGFIPLVTEVLDRNGRPVPFGAERVSLDDATYEPCPFWAATHGWIRVRGDAAGGTVRGRARLVFPKRVRSVEIPLQENPRSLNVGRYRIEWTRVSASELELRFDGPRRHAAGLFLLPSVRVDGAATRVDPGFEMAESSDNGVPKGPDESYPYRIAVLEDSRTLTFDFIAEGTEREIPFTVQVGR